MSTNSSSNPFSMAGAQIPLIPENSDIDVEMQESNPCEEGFTKLRQYINETGLPDFARVEEIDKKWREYKRQLKRDLEEPRETRPDGDPRRNPPQAFHPLFSVKVQNGEEMVALCPFGRDRCMEPNIDDDLRAFVSRPPAESGRLYLLKDAANWLQRLFSKNSILSLAKDLLAGTEEEPLSLPLRHIPNMPSAPGEVTDLIGAHNGVCASAIAAVSTRGRYILKLVSSLRLLACWRQFRHQALEDPKGDVASWVKDLCFGHPDAPKGRRELPLFTYGLMMSRATSMDEEAEERMTAKESKGKVEGYLKICKIFEAFAEAGLGIFALIPPSRTDDKLRRLGHIYVGLVMRRLAGNKDVALISQRLEENIVGPLYARTPLPNLRLLEPSLLTNINTMSLTYLLDHDGSIWIGHSEHLGVMDEDIEDPGTAEVPIDPELMQL